jgi:hypothetical protein
MLSNPFGNVRDSKRLYTHFCDEMKTENTSNIYIARYKLLIEKKRFIKKIHRAASINVGKRIEIY